MRKNLRLQRQQNKWRNFLSGKYRNILFDFSTILSFSECLEVGNNLISHDNFSMKDAKIYYPSRYTKLASSNVASKPSRSLYALFCLLIQGWPWSWNNFICGHGLSCSWRLLDVNYHEFLHQVRLCGHIFNLIWTHKLWYYCTTQTSFFVLSLFQYVAEHPVCRTNFWILVFCHLQEDLVVWIKS